MSDPRLQFDFDENLRERPRDPSGMAAWVQKLKTASEKEPDNGKRVRLLGEIGAYQRILGRLDEAERSLRQALELIARHRLPEQEAIKQKIRLAHVWQWQKKFQLADGLFQQAFMSCRKLADNQSLLAFCWQHAGKNFFDQNRFDEALFAFQNALALREACGAPADQLQSSKKAIEVTSAKRRT